MSLKIVHFFFIVVSALMCMGVGYFRIMNAGDSDTWGMVIGAGAIACGVGLIAYGIRFMRKYRELSNL